MELPGPPPSNYVYVVFLGSRIKTKYFKYSVFFTCVCFDETAAVGTTRQQISLPLKMLTNFLSCEKVLRV